MGTRMAGGVEWWGWLQCSPSCSVFLLTIHFIPQHSSALVLSSKVWQYYLLLRLGLGLVLVLGLGLGLGLVLVGASDNCQLLPSCLLLGVGQSVRSAQPQPRQKSAVQTTSPSDRRIRGLAEVGGRRGLQQRMMVMPGDHDMQLQEAILHK
jgi:hypothetical protein